MAGYGIWWHFDYSIHDRALFGLGWNIMIQIEYLLDALRIDVMENKAISDPHQLKLLNMLDGCPIIPMSINPIKLAQKGMEVQKYLSQFEKMYLEYGGNEQALRAISKDYENNIVKALKGFRR